jgi:hypothetical protein
VGALTSGLIANKSLYDAEYALIRPDQHAAWRGNELPPDFGGLIGRASGC